MKKLGVALLAALLCLVAFTALAETSPVVQNGALAAYQDGDGHLYLPGNPSPINRAEADALVSIDAYRLLFTSPREDGASDLYIIDLGNFSERLLAEDVHAACLADESALYYVTNAERTQLMRMDLADQSLSLAYTTLEPIDRLYRSAEGLVFALVDQAGTMVYVSQTDSFENYLGTLPRAAS